MNFKYLSDDVHIFCHLGGRCGTCYSGFYTCPHYDKENDCCKKRHDCHSACVVKPLKFLRFIYLGSSPYRWLEDFLIGDYLGNAIYEINDGIDLSGLLTKKQYKFIRQKAKIRAENVWKKFPHYFDKYRGEEILSDDYDLYAQNMRNRIKVVLNKSN